MNASILPRITNFEKGLIMSDEMKLEELEEEIVLEIISAITNYEGDSVIEEKIQPPRSVIHAAARAAAQVFISFERGMRINV